MSPINETTPQELVLDGYPAFDFSAEDAWPMPPVKPYVPKPRDLTLGERMKAALVRWDNNA